MQQLELLDHLVGERQKIHRQLDTRGLCGLEVDELVVCRLLERQATADAKFRQSGRGQPPFLGRSKSTMEAAAGFPELDPHHAALPAKCK